MKRYGNLWPKICSKQNLLRAHRNARKDKAAYTAVQKTDKDLVERIDYICYLLTTHSYKVAQYKTSKKHDRKKDRILYKLPYYPDRIIQWAIMQQIEPIFLKTFTPFTCASLPGRGIHYASSLIDKAIKNDVANTQYFLKMDIKKFYPSINQEILSARLRHLFKDPELLYEFDNIINSFDNTDILHLNLTEEEKEIYCRPGYGVPIGSYLSQYFANFYLASFDHWLKEELKCPYVIRYMDDIIIFSDSKEFLHNTLDAAKSYLQDNLDLQVKGNYAIRPTDLGVDMVGYRHFRDYKRLRMDNLAQLHSSLKLITNTDFLTLHEWQSAMSLIGWATWSNSYNLLMKEYPIALLRLNQFYYTFGRKYFNIEYKILTNYNKHH